MQNNFSPVLLADQYNTVCIYIFYLKFGLSQLCFKILAVLQNLALMLWPSYYDFKVMYAGIIGSSLFEVHCA